MDFITPIFTVILSSVSALAGWKIAKPRIFQSIAEFIDQYIEEKAEDFLKNPERLSPFFDALIKQGMKSTGIERAGRPQSLNIFGLKIPANIAEIGMRMLAPKLDKMLSTEGAEAAASAFG